MVINAFSSENSVRVPINRGELNVESGKSNQITLLYTGMVTISDYQSITESDSDVDTDRDQSVPFLTRVQLVNLQSSDHCLSTIKNKLVDLIPSKQWREPYLRQFRRDSKCLRVVSDLLVIDRKDRDIPLVTFDYLVDYALKTHGQLAHIGKHKMEYFLRRQLYHPAMNKVIVDICRTCEHCQLFKVASQSKFPPTIRIRSRFPFDLVAMDLLQFPKSSNGNIVVLVVVDHYSKFVITVPLRDKKSDSVCKALNAQVFPHMVRLPTRVLTDHGGEFSSGLFEETLRALNINHVYSSRYRPQGNGAVERVNRTITEFLRGIVSENPLKWDVALGKAVIVYNNTWHSTIDDTPSSLLLSRSHIIDETVPLDADTVKPWIDSHDDFCSFTVDQKVVLKVMKIGNQLKYKLGQKYTGPYSVVKVQSNGVSYEISDGSDVIKAHHKQLRLWSDPPDYLSNISRATDLPVVEHEVRHSLSTSSEISMFTDLPNFSCTETSNMSDEYDEEIVREVRSCSWITVDLVARFEDLRGKFHLYLNKIDRNNQTESDKVTEESITNWSFDEDDFCLDSEVPKLSSPMFTMNRKAVEFEDDVLSVIQKDNSTENDNDRTNISDSFLLWLEQSLIAQRDFVSKVVTVSNSLNDAWLEDMSDVLALSSCSEDQFTSDDRNNILKNMSDQLERITGNVLEYRRDKSSVAFKQRISAIHDSRTVVGSLSEVSDIVPEMIAKDSAIVKRLTRSQGNVPEFPHVMSKPIEYKSYLRL